MATPNTAEKNERASDFASDFAGATLEILDGATVLATHIITTLGSPTNGLLTATLANSGEETIANSGTADGATFTNGALSYDLTVGVGSGDVQVADLSYVQNGTSTINSFTVQF